MAHVGQEFPFGDARHLGFLRHFAGPGDGRFKLAVGIPKLYRAAGDIPLQTLRILFFALLNELVAALGFLEDFPITGFLDLGFAGELIFQDPVKCPFLAKRALGQEQLDAQGGQGGGVGGRSIGRPVCRAQIKKQDGIQAPQRGGADLPPSAGGETEQGGSIFFQVLQHLPTDLIGQPHPIADRSHLAIVKDHLKAPFGQMLLQKAEKRPECFLRADRIFENVIQGFHRYSAGTA